MWTVLLLVASSAHALTLPGYTGPVLDLRADHTPVPSGHLFSLTVRVPSPRGVAFWVQGGPGCSGLLGLFTEGGGLRVQPDNRTVTFDAALSWGHSLQLDTVWLEQPLGTGFSSGASVVHSDGVAASDAAAFLVRYLEQRAARYAALPVWLFGESHGGLYIPQTLRALLATPDGRRVANSIHGIALGNPRMFCGDREGYANPYVRGVTMEVLAMRGLVQWTTWRAWQQQGCDIVPPQHNASCDALYDGAVASFGGFHGIGSSASSPGLDPDNFFQDPCTGNGTLQAASYSGPCSPPVARVTAYLNRPDVQTALGVSGVWQVCSPTVSDGWRFDGGDMIALLAHLKAKLPQMRILFYNGDLDIATIPAAMTRYCLAQWPAAVATQRAWYFKQRWAGLVEEHRDYTWVSLHGAGHVAPSNQPQLALHVIQSLVHNKTLN